MVTNYAFRKALLNSALQGKALSPEQIMAAMYGRMGGVFGKLQGNIGATVAEIRPPKVPDMPKPIIAGIDILKAL